METVIEVKNLEKTFRSRVREPGLMPAVKSLVKPKYRTTRAVDGISFSVRRGEILAFIGPNGAGKSTTIKLVTGILYPDAGTISVLGLNPQRQRKQLSYRIGTVFGQKSQLWYHLPPIDSFHLLSDIYDLDRQKAARRIELLTEIFEIGDYLKVPVRKLSLGERIRCEIAASLIHSPEIVFLDEPTIGLDVVVKRRVRSLIKKINQEDKTTIFLTSHDTIDIERICRRAIVINHGITVWDNSVKKMKYGFMSKKIIDLRSEAPVQIATEGVRILKAKNSSAKLEVDLKVIDLDDAIEAIMKSNRIEDIRISDPPMEEVISAIYARDS
jgi:ABC-2 type transport system ATP-binding protein